MTKKLILAAVLMLSFTMVSCTSEPSTSNNNNTNAEQNNDNNNSSKTENDKNNEEEKVNKIKLSIYTIDENTLEPNESSTIEIKESLSLEDKVKELAKTVSEKRFSNLTIEVKSIDTVEGKKVATINLVDTDTKTWVPKFQGSTGGSVTSNTLIENFLQANNKSKGEWIDGVKFLYNNETIEYDHVADLSNVQYRN